ncbi:MAG: TonB-dependent receptor plug domain-containing protein, partial [Sphingomonas sp.]
MPVYSIFLVLAAPSGQPAAPVLTLVPQAAPDDGIAPDDVKRDDIIVSATGVPQAAETVAQAVTVINRQTIAQRQTVVLADLLATTPGVTVTRNGGIGGFTGVRIRGAEADQTLVLIDGVRVNDPSSPGGGFDFGTLLSGAVDRVEVLRGPNAVAWG